MVGVAVRNGGGEEAVDGMSGVPGDYEGRARRRVWGRGGRLCRQQSLSRDLEHAAKETYLLTSLSFKLLGFLG
ncbi:hypothetical protein MLD38_022578 [Melastoma candidum]|nr:hypothetical protein MLD38_022578 [Melastoma candidum]